MLISDATDLIYYELFRHWYHNNDEERGVWSNNRLILVRITVDLFEQIKYLDYGLYRIVNDYINIKI